MVKVKYPIVVITVFLWIGFVCAISFMEAWLKFQAPGITTQIGLGIGKLVFTMLNKVECLFSLVIIGNALLSKEYKISPEYVLFLIPCIILMIQTTWLLPELNYRAELIIGGEKISKTYHHFYYISLEFLKVLTLGIFGIKLFKKNHNGTKRYHSGN